MTAVTPTSTVLQALIYSLQQAANHNTSTQVPPAAILWTDQKQQWIKLAPLLRDRLPNFFTFGDYDPENRVGSAIWLKCAIANLLPNLTYSDTPIIYIPGVSRQDLRAIDSCPWLLQPLAELQYRGTFWTQRSTRDWTICAFLKSKDGLGLDVAQDEDTLQAMQTVLPSLAEVRILDLQGRKLEARDFHTLVMPDEKRDLLLWLNNPRTTQQTWDSDRWSVFCNITQDTYGFDPRHDGELVAAEQLANRQNHWATVWTRFAEAPQRYPNIPNLLRQVAPQAIDLFTDLSSYPQHNEAQEDELRNELSKLQSQPSAIATISALEQQHGKRRQWVWSALNQSPLANALKHLTQLANYIQNPLGGESPQTMAEQYTQHGWQADAAVLSAIATVDRDADLQAVTTAIRALYTPWLERSAAHLQILLKSHSYPTPPTPTPLDQSECLLFADGLRFDVGKLLAAQLQDWTVEAHWQWVALPGVTATAKPAISPIASLLQGSETGVEFRPTLRNTHQALTHDRFIKLLESQDIQFLDAKDTGNPNGKAWTEFGEIDHYGHQHGHKLAHHIQSQTRNLALRVEALLNAGWQRIRIVTDHGWLLLPGGLPKQELPGHLTQTRWGRCASLKTTTQTDLPTYPWFWSSDITIASASDIRCFKAGLEYAHGGISLQECVTPTFVISGAAPTYSAVISTFKWLGLRCRITTDHATDGMKVDIRKKPADPSTSLANGGKAIVNNAASLVIEDDTTEGDPAVLVLLDPQGNAIAKQPTIIGGDA